MTRYFSMAAAVALLTLSSVTSANAQSLRLNFNPQEVRQRFIQQIETALQPPRYQKSPYQEIRVLPPEYVNPAPTLGIRAKEYYGVVEVTSVVCSSAASRMGLEAGDRILEINGRQIQSLECIPAALRDATLYHNGKVTLLVDNVRARYSGCNRQRYVTVSTYLDGYPILNEPCPYRNDVIR